MRKICFDSNGWDFVLESHPIQALMEDLVGSGKLRIYRYYLQMDENDNMPTEKKCKLQDLIDLRERFQEVELTQPGLVLGIGRLDKSLIADSEFDRIYWRFFKDSKRDKNASYDAAIAASASTHGLVLVTGDKKLMEKSEEYGLEHVGLPDFEEWLKEI